MTPLLKINNLTCERDDKLLFNLPNFQAFSGELWQLTGHNGAGKTSFLKILAGLLWFPEGELTWQWNAPRRATPNRHTTPSRHAGLDPASTPDCHAGLDPASTTAGLRLGGGNDKAGDHNDETNRHAGGRNDKAAGHINEYLGYIGHQIGLRDELSAEENLQWLVALHGESSHLIRPTLFELGLKGYTDVPLSRLSAGQKRRVALSRLWFSDKQVWLLDEPFTAIDASGVLQLEAQLQRLTVAGKLVIYTSHHQVNPNAKRIELAHGRAKVMA